MIKDINDKEVKEGDVIRVYSKYYDVKEIFGVLWAMERCDAGKQPHNLMLTNWNKSFEIIKQQGI